MQFLAVTRVERCNLKPLPVPNCVLTPTLPSEDFFFFCWRVILVFLSSFLFRWATRTGILPSAAQRRKRKHSNNFSPPVNERARSSRWLVYEVNDGSSVCWKFRQFLNLCYSRETKIKLRRTSRVKYPFKKNKIKKDRTVNVIVGQNCVAVWVTKHQTRSNCLLF